jgi:hypothetical protein
MKVLRILTDIRLVIAELEVNLGEEVRNSPTLCAVVPGVQGAQDQVVPLSTTDGRPIFMKIDNAISPQLSYQQAPGFAKNLSVKFT